MAASPLTVERFGRGSGKGVLCLRGPLTMGNVPFFQNAIRREESSDTIILDFSEVPFMDSSGLGTLVTAYVSRQKAGRRVVLTGINERVLKLFEITKTESLFLIFPTIDDAMAALSGPSRA